MVFCAAVLVAVVPLVGGDLRRLRAVRLRAAWVVFVALAVQVLVITIVPQLAHGWEALAHVLTYVGALVVVGLNWRVPGIVVIGAGTFANGLAIAVNHGTLPASAAALRVAGIHTQAGDFVNSGPLAHPHLAWLGDRFASPSFLPFRNVVSIGDLVILAGLALLLWRTCRVGRRDTAVPVGSGTAAVRDS